MRRVRLTARAHRSLAVAVILVRHVFGYALGLIRLDRIVGGRRRPRARWMRHTGAEHARLAIEELGVASIKLGQIVSTRDDLLPPAYRVELAKLQDATPPEPAGVIEAVVVGELGRPLDTIFDSFDPQPVAAASIGQAHAAVLPDGDAVIVKIRRPGVVEQVEVDLDILDRTVRRLVRISPAARRYGVDGLSREFAATLRAELDYRREADNIDRFTANFDGDRTVHIPAVYRALSTERVLVLERMKGLKIDDHAALDATGIDRALVAQRATTAMLRMIFEHGFFHADPHPGNFFVESDGRIGLIDFGMVGTVDDETRTALRAVLLAVVEQNSAPLIDAFVALGVTTTPPDRIQLAADFDRLIAEHLLQPLSRLSVAALLRDVLTIVRRHRFHLPSNLALLAKTLAMSEGVAAQLDPSFEMTVAVAPFLSQLMGTVPPPNR
jgi:ubiquinone biosynthesis protein